MRRLFYYAFIILVIYSCQDLKSKKGSVSTIENVGTASNITTTEYRTRSGKKFVLYVNKSIGASISDIQIETLDFTESNTVHRLGETDPIKNVLVTDLDKNGFDEIYIFTTSAGSGSYGTIYGIASNKDKSATPIYIYEATEEQRKKGGLFEGFRGHNSFALENGKLTNTFPIYTNKDVNSLPTGGEIKVIYSLIAGEAGWILKPEEIIP